MATSYAYSISSYHWTSRIIAAPIREAKPAKITCCASTQKWGINRNFTAAFYPSIYHKDQINDDVLSIKHAQNVMDIKHLLKAEGENSLKDLMLVDAIQRLGIDHHFQEEIEAVLWKQHISNKNCLHQAETLYEVLLCFRLLRQEGYYVPPEVFNNFKDEKGRFAVKFQKDNIRLLMELYEAAQLSIDGEDILDDAAEFSSKLLNAGIKYLDDENARIVKTTLKHPYRKSLAKFKAQNFMGGFAGINGWEKSLQELTYANFYMAQGIHRQELLHISKWWEDLGLASELKNARDQPLKWYAWPMAALTDLSSSDERIELTKSISFIYIIDDIFDLYGKPEELTLFTEAVNRWDLAAVEQLPDYMKKCFRALYDITNKTGIKIHKKHGFNPTQSLRKTWASLCNAFLVESRWFCSGSQYLPKADEYLKNGKESSGVQVVLVHLFFLLGFGATEYSPISVNDISGVVSSVSAILRLWDDLGSAKDEDQNGHDGSYIDYYMKEHEGVSIEFAREHVLKLIADEWKRLNKECLRLNRFSASFQRASLNIARMVPLMYSYDDNQGLPELDVYINSMLFDDLSSDPKQTDKTEIGAI